MAVFVPFDCDEDYDCSILLDCEGVINEGYVPFDCDTLYDCSAQLDCFGLVVDSDNRFFALNLSAF